MAYGLIIQRRLDHKSLQSIRNGQESVSGIKWNRCPDCSEMAVRNTREYARTKLKKQISVFGKLKRLDLGSV
jgi:hypothetical protein